MWKKEEPTPPVAQPTTGAPRRVRDPGAAQGAGPAAPSAEAAPRGTPRASATGHAAIGPSITIKGEVSGEEDLLIQGTVEGSVDLGHHAVQVGREGRVTANISGRIVTVEGEVEGDLVAEEQIVLRPSARVKGDLTAPRVVLEDGARFRGMVEMGEAAGSGKAAGKAASARAGAGNGVSGRARPAPAVGGTDASGKDTSRAGADKPDAASDRSKPEPEKVGGEAR